MALVTSVVNAAEVWNFLSYRLEHVDVAIVDHISFTNIWTSVASETEIPNVWKFGNFPISLQTLPFNRFFLKKYNESYESKGMSCNCERRIKLCTAIVPSTNFFCVLNVYPTGMSFSSGHLAFHTPNDLSIALRKEEYALLNFSCAFRGATPFSHSGIWYRCPLKGAR